MSSVAASPVEGVGRVSAAQPAGRSRASTLTGLGPLVGFVLRRDRLRLVLWLLGVVGIVAVSAASLPPVYPDQAAIDQYAALLGNNPALIVFAGPGHGFDDPSIGVILVNETQQFAFIGIALMSIFLLNRNTRADEDSERADLVRSNVVGRHAPTAAAVAVVAALDVVVGALCAASFVALDYPVAGSVALAGSFVAVGLVFTGVAAVAAQVAGSGRATLGLASIVLAAAFTVRAVGDVGDNWLTWASPLGWAQNVQAFAGEQPWTLALCAIAAAGLVVAAFWLSTRRDLGSGLVAHRPGRARAATWSRSALGLALRLQRGSLVGWAVGMFATGVVYGSITEDIEQMIVDNPTFSEIFARTGASFVDSFVATSMVMLATMAAGFSISSVLRLRGEESAGRVDQILATGTSRTGWMASHLTIAVVGTVLVVLAGGLGFGLAAATVTSDSGQVTRLLGAALVTVPAVLVLVGVAVALFGLAPAWTPGAWMALGVVAVIGYLGEVLRLPHAVRQVSPMEHLPAVPAVDLEILPIALLLAVAVGLVALGVWGFRRRDVGVG